MIDRSQSSAKLSPAPRQFRFRVTHESPVNCSQPT